METAIKPLANITGGNLLVPSGEIPTLEGILQGISDFLEAQKKTHNDYLERVENDRTERVQTIESDPNYYDGTFARSLIDEDDLLEIFPEYERKSRGYHYEKEQEKKNVSKDNFNKRIISAIQFFTRDKTELDSPFERERFLQGFKFIPHQRIEHILSTGTHSFEYAIKNRMNFVKDENGELQEIKFDFQIEDEKEFIERYGFIPTEDQIEELTRSIERQLGPRAEYLTRFEEESAKRIAKVTKDAQEYVPYGHASKVKEFTELEEGLETELDLIKNELDRENLHLFNDSHHGTRRFYPTLKRLGELKGLSKTIQNRVLQDVYYGEIVEVENLGVFKKEHPNYDGYLYATTTLSSRINLDSTVEAEYRNSIGVRGEVSVDASTQHNHSSSHILFGSRSESSSEHDASANAVFVGNSRVENIILTQDNNINMTLYSNGNKILAQIPFDEKIKYFQLDKNTDTLSDKEISAQTLTYVLNEMFGEKVKLGGYFEDSMFKVTQVFAEHENSYDFHVIGRT